MSHDVFICHSSKDRTIANAICSRLEQDRIRCWIAPRDVVPGSEYARSIIEAISEAKLAVLVFSDNSNSSPHVRREIERTASHGIPILPFRVDDVTPSPALEYFISDAHWLDALTPPLEQHLDHLVGTVRVLLEREASAQSIPPPPAVPVTTGAPASPPAARHTPGTEEGAASGHRARHWWPWALLGGLALVGAIVVGYLLLGSGSDSGEARAYGDDPRLDALWDACEAGDGKACDDLFLEAPDGSEYGDFGFTCGNRYDGGELCADVMDTTVADTTPQSTPPSGSQLEGTLSVDPTSVSGVQPVTISYSITNASGRPIEAATTEILVLVGADLDLSGVVLADISQDIAAGATVDGSVQSDLLGAEIGTQSIGIVTGTRIAGGTTESQVIAETTVTIQA